MSEKLAKNKANEQIERGDSHHELLSIEPESNISIIDKAEQDHKARESEREALEDAKDLAHSTDKELTNHQRPASPAERRRGAPSKKQLEKSFQEQMRTVKSDLDPGSRILSTVFHFAPIEKVSNVVSSTLARPNAMLSGSIAAFISITVIYFVARYYGYRLSGLETVAAFAIGWILGIVYDYFVHLFRRRNHN